MPEQAPYNQDVLDGLDTAFKANGVNSNQLSVREHDAVEAGKLIGRGVAGSSRLFSNGIPEATVEKAEKWEALPAKYRELVIKFYENKVAAVDGYIENGLLNEVYKLPDLLAFAEQFEVLWPSFDYMEKNDWQPTVVFVPRGLNEKGWNYLFKNHKLPDDTVPSDSVGSELWEVGVISGAERPVFLDVSKDGSTGSNVAGAVNALHLELLALSESPTANGISSIGEVIADASPDREFYLAFQLSLLMNGLPPVDLNTRTIGKESCNTTNPNTGGTVTYHFDGDDYCVVSGCQPNNESTPNSGIRPAVLGRDLVRN